MQIPGQIIYVLLGKLSSSKRAQRRTYSQNYMCYGKDVPYTSIIMLLTLVFCVISPFLTAAAVFYFAVRACQLSCFTVLSSSHAVRGCWQRVTNAAQRCSSIG